MLLGFFHGEVVQALTFAYLVVKYPGVLMMLAGALMAIVIAWKHNQAATSWKFNPRQVFDGALLLVMLYLFGMGTALTFFLEY